MSLSSLRALALAGGMLALLPGTATAVSVSDILPLFLEKGPGGFGFLDTDVENAGLTPQFSATSLDTWIAAGAADTDPIRIEAQELQTVHVQPAQPTAANPVIADSTWTVRNLSDVNLVAPLLVFSTVDPAGAYPIAEPPTGLDGTSIDLLSYTFANTEYLLGAIQLPDLEIGAFTDIDVRYVVAGSLAGNDPEQLPALGVRLLSSYAFVPEPATALLVAGGLLGLIATARRRV